MHVRCGVPLPECPTECPMRRIDPSAGNPAATVEGRRVVGLRWDGAGEKGRGARGRSSRQKRKSAANMEYDRCRRF